MSKEIRKLELDQELSNIIYKFFDGDINKITKTKIKTKNLFRLFITFENSSFQ